MAQLSEKELSFLGDILCEEALLVNKFKMLAEQADTEELKEKMLKLSKRHQQHFDTVYAKLS